MLLNRFALGTTAVVRDPNRASQYFRTLRPPLLQYGHTLPSRDCRGIKRLEIWSPSACDSPALNNSYFQDLLFLLQLSSLLCENCAIGEDFSQQMLPSPLIPNGPARIRPPPMSLLPHQKACYRPETSNALNCFSALPSVSALL